MQQNVDRSDLMPDQPAGADRTPLIVDLDGTLLRSDLLHDTLALAFPRTLESWRQMIGAFREGKAQFKAHLAERAQVNYAVLPYDAAVIDLIKQARAAGRPVYLASAADRRHVDAIARHLDLFDGTFASDGYVNLAGGAKAEALVARFGERSFDYLGNSSADLPIWSKARRAMTVRLPAGPLARLRSGHSDVSTHGEPAGGLRDVVRAMRPYQYAKNALVFVPLLTSQSFTPWAVLHALLAFAAFCLAASSVYITNDLLDLQNDREHGTKKQRPFASGRLSAVTGTILSPALFVAAAALALSVSLPFFGALCVYAALSTYYSISLKRRMIVDVIALAALYTGRIFGGAIAIDVAVSRWLFAFSVLIFFALALIKRYCELVARIDLGLPELTNRNYAKGDLSVISALAAASALNAVTVYALFVSSPEVATRYRHPDLLWLICPILLYWLARALMMAHRRWMHDDPIIFALKDRNSWVAGALSLAVVVAATL